MWRLLNKNKDCDFFCELLENSAGAGRSSVDLEEFRAAFPPASRAHFANCEKCHRVAEDFFAARSLLLRAAISPIVPGPWFASRVMNAIGAREAELARAASAWIAVSKYAFRLAFVTLAAILLASTMLVEKPTATRSAAAVDQAQEGLFENAPPPMTQDEVLVSLAERAK